MTETAFGYLPILVFLGIALLISIGLVVLPMLVSRLTGNHKPTAEKLSEYECGFPAFEKPTGLFNVSFYRVGLLFLLFDLELAFLLPWAIVVFDLGWGAWYAMMVFLGVLTVGFAYEWKQGGLDWE